MPGDGGGPLGGSIQDASTSRWRLMSPSGLRSIPAWSAVVSETPRTPSVFAMPMSNGPTVTEGAAAASWPAIVSSLPGHPVSTPGSSRAGVPVASTEPSRTNFTVFPWEPTLRPSSVPTSGTSRIQPPTRSITASIAAAATTARRGVLTDGGRTGARGDEDAETARLPPPCRAAPGVRWRRGPGRPGPDRGRPASRPRDEPDTDERADHRPVQVEGGRAHPDRPARQARAVDVDRHLDRVDERQPGDAADTDTESGERVHGRRRHRAR